jgi:hypothetical protein
LICAAAVFFCPELVCAVAQPDVPSADSSRVQQHLTELARFGANPEGGVSRIAYSDADIAGRVYVKSLMEAAGLDVRIDAAGSLIGRREGTDRKLPTIVVGSHTDSVPHGGIDDGDVGVIGGTSSCTSSKAERSSAPIPTLASCKALSAFTGGRLPLPASRTTRGPPRWTSATMPQRSIRGR